MAAQAGLAIITGATGGIGQHVARRCAQRGLRTLLIARRADRLQQLASELAEHAPSHLLALDLTSIDTIGPALSPLLDEHGPARVLVNNAGVGQCSPFLDTPIEHERELMAVNYTAAATLIRLTLPAMLERGRGHVINVASIATKSGPWGHSTYVAAKSALVALTHTLATEYSGRGVTFSYVNPGVIRTPFFDTTGYERVREQTLRHALPPEYAADRIVGLLDHPKLELCIPSHYRVLDWVRALSPAWVQRLVAYQSRPKPAPSPSPATPTTPTKPDPDKVARPATDTR